MKNKKLPLHKRLLFQFRQWRSDRNRKILDTMVTFTFDEALRLANKKRDLTNHKAWVINGTGEFLVFCRYQMKNLQRADVLQKHLNGKSLDEKASYIAHPVTEKNRKRGGLIRKWISPEPVSVSR